MNGHEVTTHDEVPREFDSIEREAAKYAGRSHRRHSAAVFTQTLKPANGFHRRPLELYLVRVYPACRAVWFYLLQHNIPHILVDVDFSQGEARLPEVVRRQPHREVPILVDGEFVIFDGPAILAYLGSNYTDHAGYGFTLQARLTTESLLSWANAELHRCVGFNYTYPQFLDKYSLPDARANEALVEQGLKQLGRHLELLEKKYLESAVQLVVGKYRKNARQCSSEGNKPFLTGNRPTIADTYVATVLVQVEWSGTHLAMWPHVEKWLGRVKN
ncbi:GSTT3-like protein, partial [Mya arenaria]